MTMAMLSLARAGLMLVTCAGLVAAAANAIAPYRTSRLDATAAIDAAPDRPPPPAANGDSLARVVASRDVFRLSRAPAAVRFDPRAPEGMVPQPPAPARPAPVVAGILSGSEPAVLLEIPGIEGTKVLRAGERAGDYLVRSISPERVVVSSRDTTWTLKVRNQFN
jgi:hypothetical protein